MRHLPTIAGALLGLLFLLASLTFLLGLAPEVAPPPEGSPAALFMGAFVPTGYLTFVKVVELVGGVLVALPRTRNLGLLCLGPVIVNIAAYHGFVLGGEGFFAPMVVAVYALALYLLWHERRAFAALVAPRRAG